MRLLFRHAFDNSKHLTLLLVTLISMLFLTAASQLEVLAMGVITKKGPDVFELFSPIEQGELTHAQSITKEEMNRRFQAIDKKKRGYISRKDVWKFLSNYNRKGLLDRILSYAEQRFPLSGNLWNLAYLVVAVALVKAASLFSHRFTTRLVAIRVSRDLRQKYFEHLQSLPMSFYQEQDIGSLSARVVTDALGIAEGINAALVNYLQTPFTLATTLALCFFTSWKLTLMILFGFPLIIYPIAFIAKKVKEIARQLQKNQEGFTSTLIEFLAGIQTVKMFAMEEFSRKKYQEQNDRMAALEKKSAKYDMSSRPIVHTVGMLILASVLLFGLYFLHMDVPDVLVYCGFLYVFYEPVKKFAETNSLIQRGAAAAERMEHVLEIKPQIQDHPNAINLHSFEESIEFKGVWFRYNESWIIKNFNLTIRKGETLALVGPTGSGKSTLVQLLPRLYDVQRGEVRIDGLPLSAYTRRSLRELIAFVPQRPFLFLDTIAENISYGRPHTEDKLELAAKKAHAAEFIETLPHKYGAKLAEGGKNLSGGQQQRLAIARALFKNSPILVMDEATSSLDSVSEQQIKNAISELKGSITQIIIAHRLSTIEDADRIIFIDRGEKLAEGNKEELLQSCPSFRIMWETMHKIKLPC